MADFFEIDFLSVESNKSGDAIAIRYEVSGKTCIHVVDAGFAKTGTSVVEHINKYYDAPTKIDHVVVTHNDRDHSGGIISVLENFEIGTLWLLRPWLYADELLPRFKRFTNVENLKKRLQEIYSNLKDIEDFAIKNGIKIEEPFQGANVGEFKVMAPSKDFYLDLVVTSDKTPEEAEPSGTDEEKTFWESVKATFGAVVNFVKSSWGQENLSLEDTSAENNMSVVQYANLCGQSILLTGDAGRESLNQCVEYSPVVGLTLPGIDRFQVPHHGSRRNVSSELLDKLLGEKLAQATENKKFTAIISSALNDKAHPRQAVVAALHHRGAKVIATESKCIRTGHNAPKREGWVATEEVPYPTEQEE